jgi:transketolase
MRKYFSDYMSSSDYLLHADMWNCERFPTKANIINAGLGEANLLNIASGIASTNKTVFVYGVCGFIIHRYEQLKFSVRDFASKRGKIILFNAGKIGYEKYGSGHALDDDIQLMNILNIPVFDPIDLEDLKTILTELEQYNRGVFYIRLGKDE